MSKGTAPKRSMSTRTLAFCALLAAISVVLARLIIPMPNASTRFSIEAVPIYLSGMLFGPMAGGLVGFSADLVGCLFSGYGYNPIFCVPPILYGVFGGLMRNFLGKGVNIPRLIISFLPPVLLLYTAGRSRDTATLQLIRNLSVISLILTMVLLILNFLTVLSSEALGQILHYVLIIVSCPMICSGHWAMSLFLWACLLTASLRQLKK